MDYCTLSNSNGIELEVARFGGIIKKLMVPDRYGDVADIVLGFDELEDYQDRSPYFGALVGRYGNRIAKGRFTLDGEVYSLAVNDGVNHLHGGLIGFDKVLWEAEEFSESGESGVRL
ncbi:MAG: galactose-1-epimerase, partial [Verrucomicrobia bacterium]|nr:galactose-1-epimerase [Verrucomicrobiota bacterium]